MDLLQKALSVLGNIGVNTAQQAQKMINPIPQGSVEGVQTQAPDLRTQIANRIRNGQSYQDLVGQPPQTNQTNQQDYTQTIAKGLANWGGDQSLAPIFAKAAEQYPIFKQNPYLLPAISILETGGGDPSKLKQPYNVTNWGITLPQGYFTPKSYDEVINKTASGIAERMPAFEKFRQSGNLADLGNVYAPTSDNPGTGGQNYAINLQKVMDVFNSLQNK